MALLNYTTEIDAWRTIGEIQQLLARAGASHFSIRNEGGIPVAITFAIEYNDKPLNFSLPCNVQGIQNHLKKDATAMKSGKLKSRLREKPMEEHANNVGWRILKNWIESQIAMVEIEMASIQEIFIQYLVLDAKGTTLAQFVLKGEGQKLLEL